MTRIYTRTGDDGTTGLAGGSRTSKASQRVEAYGSVDEAASALGVARAAAGMEPDLDAILAAVQSDLMFAGAQLATPPSGPTPPAVRLVPERIEALERAIDALEAGLPELRSFILPAGCAAGAALLLARAVVRRAERRVVELVEREPAAELGTVQRYLNRLSDLLFVMGRAVNKRAGAPEQIWPAS